MIKVYGAPICSDCRDLKEKFDEIGMEYEFIDITENIANLRAFLQLRDNNEIYKSIKEEGRVGIPTIVLEDGTITLEWEGLLTENKCEFC